LPGISDPESSEVLGKLIGRAEYTDQQVSLGADGRISRSFSTRHDAMATPDTLRQLRAGSGIVIHRDSPPALVNLPFWFEKSRYRRLAKIPYFRAAEHVRR
jgi:type IV secretory pathway TraG/TraD family ATPase VirD4